MRSVSGGMAVAQGLQGLVAQALPVEVLVDAFS